jgi:hypothetical protein
MADLRQIDRTVTYLIQELKGSGQIVQAYTVGADKSSQDLVDAIHYVGVNDQFNLRILPGAFVADNIEALLTARDVFGNPSLKPLCSLNPLPRK